TERVVCVFAARGNKHIVVGLEAFGNYALPKRTFKLPSESTFTSGAVYSLGNEYFAVAVTGTGDVADFYPVIWLENNKFFGYLGEDSKVVLAGGSTIELRGLAMSNGRVCVFRTYYGFHGKIYVLDVNYV
ncbi:hypothetical protein LCGC14_3092060, partial [marine sediment metagenome]